MNVWPRQYAQRVKDGRMTLDGVPEMYRDLVSTHLEIARRHPRSADDFLHAAAHEAARKMREEQAR